MLSKTTQCNLRLGLHLRCRSTFARSVETCHILKLMRLDSPAPRLCVFEASFRVNKHWDAMTRKDTALPGFNLARALLFNLMRWQGLWKDDAKGDEATQKFDWRGDFCILRNDHRATWLYGIYRWNQGATWLYGIYRWNQGATWLYGIYRWNQGATWLYGIYRWNQGATWLYGIYRWNQGATWLYGIYRWNQGATWLYGIYRWNQGATWLYGIYRWNQGATWLYGIYRWNQGATWLYGIYRWNQGATWLYGIYRWNQGATWLYGIYRSGKQITNKYITERYFLITIHYHGNNLVICFDQSPGRLQRITK